MYGNGKTAGQIAMSRGAPANTMIYGPGNSQPHKVATCPDKNGKVHYKDVHAVKSYASNGCGGHESSTPSCGSTHTCVPPSCGSEVAKQTTCGSTSTATAGTPANASSNTSSNNAAPAAAVAAASTPATPSAPAAKAAKPAARSGVLGANVLQSSPRAGVLGATARTGSLPFTGMPLWLPALAALALMGVGLGIRRRVGPGA